MAIYEFFPHERIELMKEVRMHPELITKLEGSDAEDFVDKLALIAAHCNIALDGDYTQADLNRVCELCYKRLKSRRTQIILPL